VVADLHRLLASAGIAPPYILVGHSLGGISMRLFASNEGITIIDTKDDMVTAQASNFTGIAEVLLQLGQQLSGTFQIPLVRLFGQSPAGLSSTGESDLKTYYDNIKKRQVQDMLVTVTVIYRLLAQSVGIKVGDGFGVALGPPAPVGHDRRDGLHGVDEGQRPWYHGARSPIRRWRSGQVCRHHQVDHCLLTLT